MATNFYVDISLDFVNRSGLDSTTNVATGPGGLLAIIHGRGAVTTAAAAGDTVYIKGTGYLKQLANLTTGADKSGTWAIGDSVQDNNTGSEWTGKIIYISTTTVRVQVNSGKTYADITAANGIHNTTRTDTTTISKANMGITFNASGSLANGHIKFIGVEGTGWTVDGTRAVLDCDNIGSADGLSFNGQDFIWLQHLELANPDESGIGCSAAYTDYHVFWDLYIHHSDVYGINSNGYLRYCLFYKCRFSSCGNCAIYRSTSWTCIACLFEACTNGAMNTISAGLAYGCIFRDCTSQNIDMYSGGWLVHCVSEDPSGTNARGIESSYAFLVCVGCRSTNAIESGQAAFTGTSGVPVLCVQCVADNNTAGYLNNVNIECINAPGDTNQGYTDPSTDDYNLAAAATKRSVAVTIP